MQLAGNLNEKRYSCWENDAKVTIYLINRTMICPKYRTRCVCVKESTTTPTTVTSPTASSFSSGTFVCLHFAIFGVIIQYSQIQAAAIEKVDVIGGDNVTIYISKKEHYHLLEILCSACVRC